MLVRPLTVLRIAPRLARMPTGKEIKATALRLARLIHPMLARTEDYVERGIEAIKAERNEPTLRHLQRRANSLGLALMPAGAGA